MNKDPRGQHQTKPCLRQQEKQPNGDQSTRPYRSNYKPLCLDIIAQPPTIYNHLVDSISTTGKNSLRVLYYDGFPRVFNLIAVMYTIYLYFCLENQFIIEQVRFRPFLSVFTPVLLLVAVLIRTIHQRSISRPALFMTLWIAFLLFVGVNTFLVASIVARMIDLLNPWVISAIKCMIYFPVFSLLFELFK